MWPENWVLCQPLREKKRFQSWLSLLYGQVSAFEVRSRCFLSSWGLARVVHTFSRQFIIGLICVAPCHRWERTLSQNGSTEELLPVPSHTGLVLCSPSCMFTFISFISLHYYLNLNTTVQLKTFIVLPWEQPQFSKGSWNPGLQAFTWPETHQVNHFHSPIPEPKFLPLQPKQRGF